MTQRDYLEKDYYAALGVAKDASQADVAKAYRKLARELHPDVRPDDKDAEARFKEVGEAYAVLSNPEKRKEYDQVREMVASGRFAGFPGAGGGTNFQGFTSGGQTFDLNDLLGGFFSQSGGPTTRSRRRASRERGRDLQTDVTLSFEDAMAGVTTTLRVAGRAACTTCHGSGARPGTQVVACPTCGGNGMVTRDQGLFGFSEPCPSCAGSGRQIPDPCPTCGGSGAETRTREVRARIPAGVRDGARIRLKGRGEAGVHGAPAGDLFVNIHVEPHEMFARAGDNLTLRVPITFPEAALGTKLTVPTLDSPVTVRIPPGTENGKTFRVKGRGAPKAKGGHGDLLVIVDIAVPRKLTRTQRKLVEDLAATMDGSALRAHLQTEEV